MIPFVEPGFTIPPEWIAPLVAGIFSLVTVAAAGFIARRNSKQGTKEQRAPDVQEMWIQQEADRRARQILEDLWWDLRNAFRAYYRRVSIAIAVMKLSESEAKTFELTADEQRAIDSKPPDEIPVKMDTVR